MKKLLMIVAAMALTGAAMAMTLQAAKGQIPGVVANPAKMAEIMKDLTEDDQIEFLALVNAAIAELNGSANEISALYLAVNEAALRSHGKGNLQSLLATTFATVPPEHLTVLNERIAADLFNRNADPTRPVSDADFTALAREAMQTIAARASDTDEDAVRTTFAILMFVRASGGSPADLRQTLAESISDPAARQLALNEWIPPALGENGREPTYDPMLGASDASLEVPDVDNVLVIANSQEMVPLLSDLPTVFDHYEFATGFNMANVGMPEDTLGSLSNTMHPSAIPGTPWTTPRGRQPEPEEEEAEPRPYPYQRF